MTNSGSAVSATNAVNVNEYVHVIKEGQIKNYIWDTGTSSWVRDLGTVVNISGVQITVDISGDPVTVSGNWVDVSGATVIAKVSGQAVFVYISGGSLTATTDISGQTVFTVPQYNTFEAAAAGSGAVGLTLSVTSTYIVDYATYHATSGTTTSSELYIQLQHGTSTGFYTKMVSVDMANNAVSNIYWTPDAELWLTSGDSIAMIFSNPDTCAYGATIRVKRP